MEPRHLRRDRRADRDATREHEARDPDAPLEILAAEETVVGEPARHFEFGRNVCDRFQFDAARHVLLGERTKKRFRLADRMTVKLVRVDLESRKIGLVPA